ncbi:DNA polymerase Y family protein [Pedobacter sp. BMA]|uniref:Y-family DNA polymerase n=1 Tax=Pedobacter sp. BMA TaxID=1663685 RepID=UPI000649A45C|nr:DNA polymerase Y family protein [Pedobacter sp. BMA]KLT63860.1 nucleotidyltransferase [Pedobacter sp. BMA]
MQKRFVSIWFRQLLAEWQLIRRPELAEVPFVFSAPDHGRMMITAVSPLAFSFGVEVGMRAADAKAICPGLEILDDKPGRAKKLLKGLGEWCVRYSPVVAIDEFGMDGLLLDISGCAHLWGGEREYLKEIVSRLKSKGYTVRLAIADTPGAAWAVSHYGKLTPLIPTGAHVDALLALEPDALRLEASTLTKLRKLGFYQIKSFIGMPRSILRRRFGEDFLLRLAQAIGTETEVLVPLQVPVPFSERLACLEPIKTKVGIEIAVTKMLESLCKRMQAEGQGLRTGILTGYRIDGKIVQVSIGTSAATHSISHLFKLFELKIDQIRPGLGIELFVLDAPKVDDVQIAQEEMWTSTPGLDDQSVIRLLDRVAGKVGPQAIQRYLPATRFWPERSVFRAASITEKSVSSWRVDKPRPTELLKNPAPIEVMALIPDHPPKFFIYNGVRHLITKADGPERIEREWWLDQGEHRDYYQVEDEQGSRYWLFRSGHYGGDEKYQWFIHGFFA